MSSASRSRRRQRGFTLIEALASITLVAVGVVAAMSGMSAMTKNDYLLREREVVQRLATEKYDELVATGAIDGAELSGDFTDRNLDKYEWSAEVTPSGEENLEILTVTVESTRATDKTPRAVVDGLVFRPPIATGGAQ